MSRFWSPLVHRLTPYVPGEQPKLRKLIKLNTNENPYPPSPQAIAALRGELADDGDALRLYPDPEADRLKQAIAAHFAPFAIDSEQVFVGNGSDEILAHAFMALLQHDQPVLFPDITYSFYPVYCTLYGIAYRTVPLSEDFCLQVDDYRPVNGGIVLANPNAPTGRLLSLAAIRRILECNPDSVVVVDEAYVDFGGDTAVALVGQHANLLVVQTLSKSRSLAGLRVGYAIAQRELIEALARVKNSFNSYPLDRLAIAGAVAALADEDHFEWTRKAIMRSRETLSGALRELAFDVLPSAANFIFARHPEHDAAALAAGLRQRGIIVRHFALPRIEQYLRITIGSDEQCAILVAALHEIIGR
jgi:histidinol-phosphate aminotransferase